MGCAALMSLALWPAFEGRLTGVPRSARGPLLLGALFMGLQAISLVRTLGVYPDTTRINIVYNSRGLWSVLGRRDCRAPAPRGSRPGAAERSRRTAMMTPSWPVLRCSRWRLRSSRSDRG